MQKDLYESIQTFRRLICEEMVRNGDEDALTNDKLFAMMTGVELLLGKVAQADELAMGLIAGIKAKGRELGVDEPEEVVAEGRLEPAFPIGKRSVWRKKPKGESEAAARKRNQSNAVFRQRRRKELEAQEGTAVSSLIALIRQYQSDPQANVENWKAWYSDFYKLVEGMFREAKIMDFDTINHFMQVLSLTSPQADPTSNMRRALAALKFEADTILSGKDANDFDIDRIPGNQKQVTPKMKQLFGGEIPHFGGKTHAFWLNLVGAKTPFTLDLWMFRILFGREEPVENSGEVQYAISVLKQVQEEIGYSDEEIQAALWVIAQSYEDKKAGTYEQMIQDQRESLLADMKVIHDWRQEQIEKGNIVAFDKTDIEAADRVYQDKYQDPMSFSQKETEEEADLAILKNMETRRQSRHDAEEKAALEREKMARKLGRRPARPSAEIPVENP